MTVATCEHTEDQIMQLGSCSLLFHDGWVGCALCAAAAVTGTHTWFCPAEFGTWLLCSGTWAGVWLAFGGKTHLMAGWSVREGKLWLNSVSALLADFHWTRDLPGLHHLLGLNVGASALELSDAAADVLHNHWFQPGLPHYHLTGVGEPFWKEKVSPVRRKNCNIATPSLLYR